MEKLDIIHKKLDELAEGQTTIAVTLGRMEVDVRHHVQRTDILQESVKPLTRRYEQVTGMLKLSGWVLALLAAADGILTIWEHVK